MTKLLFVLLILFEVSSGYKLLLVFPFPNKDNWILGQGYVRHLLNAGHEITYITPYPSQNTQSLREVDVATNLKILPDEITKIEEHLENNIKMEDYASMFDIAFKIANGTLLHDNVQKLILDSNEQFDAVIADWMYNEIYAGFSSVFDCPLIWAVPQETQPLLLSLLNEPIHAMNWVQTSLQISFWQQVIEQCRTLRLKFQKWLLHNKETDLFNEAFGPAVTKRGRILPSFEKVKYNGSLVMGNSHFAVGHTIRLPHNYIQIGGFHIEEKRNPLPEGLQKVLNDSTNGAILFNMGSTLKGNSFPREIEIALLHVFKTINHTVIWKYEGELKGSKNMHVFERLPQQDVLAHPNCKLFITNGDHLSIIEAIHFGVPIIGIPIFGEQFTNVEIAVTRGFAKKLDVDANIKVNLIAIIKDMLQNSSYRDRVKSLSILYKDRPTTPANELVFWVEHVIRSKGASHLRSSLLLPWYYYYFELTFAIIVFVVIFSTLVKLIAVRKKSEQNTNFKKFL